MHGVCSPPHHAVRSQRRCCSRKVVRRCCCCCCYSCRLCECSLCRAAAACCCCCDKGIVCVAVCRVWVGCSKHQQASQLAARKSERARRFPQRWQRHDKAAACVGREMVVCDAGAVWRRFKGLQGEWRAAGDCGVCRARGTSHGRRAHTFTQARNLTVEWRVAAAVWVFHGRAV